MNIEEMNIDQLLAEYERTATYINQAKAHQELIIEKVGGLYEVPEGQDTKTYTVGDYKIQREDKIAYSLNKKALTDELLGKLPEGVVYESKDKKLSLTRFKEELQNGNEDVLKVITSKVNSKTTIKKIEEKQ